jgi:site-specific DNA-methyltransferase (adenine-specific)
LAKLPEKSAQTAMTSPPYWPLKRAYGGTGIGYEPTLDEYNGNLVLIFREVRRVLRDDGTLWVVMDDSYSKSGGVRGLDPKQPAMNGLPLQDTTYIRDAGNLLLIPTRFAMAMQDDGWFLRAEIIWHKPNMRPESVTDRPSKDFEKVLMFTKQRQYFYDPDPIRVPLVKPYSIPGKKKPGMNRGDGDRTERKWSNLMGRNAGSVWTIPPSNSYRGSHSATFPEELVRRCLLVSCPENSLVIEPFGGAGTVALVARELGHRVISIDINPAYTEEARQRLFS